MSDEPAGVMISKAPEDPEEKKEWANQMMRIQVAMWISGNATCSHCGYVYKSVDDFLRCNPHRGYGKKFNFVCSGCFKEYKEKNNVA